MAAVQIVDMGVINSVINILNSAQCGNERRKVSTGDLREWLEKRQIQTDDDNNLKELIKKSKT